jgi:D-3-phosphoglycerate dehydrogenase
LLGFDNVVLTPHIGGATRETVARHSDMIVQDIQRFVAGLKPERMVNPEVWGRFD